MDLLLARTSVASPVSLALAAIGRDHLTLAEMVVDDPRLPPGFPRAEVQDMMPAAGTYGAQFCAYRTPAQQQLQQQLNASIALTPSPTHGGSTAKKRRRHEAESTSVLAASSSAVAAIAAVAASSADANDPDKIASLLIAVQSESQQRGTNDASAPSNRQEGAAPAAASKLSNSITQPKPAVLATVASNIPVSPYLATSFDPPAPAAPRAKRAKHASATKGGSKMVDAPAVAAPVVAAVIPAFQSALWSNLKQRLESSPFNVGPAVLPLTIASGHPVAKFIQKEGILIPTASIPVDKLLPAATIGSVPPCSPARLQPGIAQLKDRRKRSGLRCTQAGCSATTDSDVQRVHHYLEKHQRHLCGGCDLHFASKDELLIHLLVHNEEMRKHTCELCGKGFKFVRDLTRHKAIHDGEKPYACEECQARFTRSAALSVHLQIHAKSRPFVCEEIGCGKTFVQKSTLTAHMRLHTGEKPFVCEICAKGYTQRSNLVIHQRTHTGDRPYACPTCDRTFINSSNLSDHLSVHTGTHKSYPCSRCTRTFSSRWNVKQHVAKAHTGEGEIGQKQAAPVLATTVSPPVPAEEQKEPSPIDLLSSHLDEQKQQQNEAAHSLDLLPFESHHGDDDSDLLEPDLHHPSNSMASHSADLPSRYSNNGAAVWPLEDVLMQHEHE